jgi:chromosome partitioning protein
MPKNYQAVIDRWQQIPTDYPEAQLEANLVQVIFESLGLNFNQLQAQKTVGKGLIPDLLVYTDVSQPPVLVVENKRRAKSLADATEESFIPLCKQQNSLYRAAVGYQDSPTNKGIKQYLDKDVVKPAMLASYGLVFNGDFFQLWRRVDGLVLPLTDIQRMTAESIPQLMQQLEYCLKNPQRALVTSVWNQKGGVSKTTNTINLGASLAIAGKKVLLIDLDEQTDLTIGVGLNPNHFNNWILDCVEKVDKNQILEAKKILSETIQHRVFPTTDNNIKINISVLPIGSESLAAFRDKKDIKQVQSFKKIIQILVSEFDYIFIDTSPAADSLTRCVLFSSDTTLIPIDYGKKSIHHGVNTYHNIPKVRQQRAQAEKFHLGTWNLGLVFSNCPPDNSSKLDSLIEKELQEKGFSGRKCSTVIKTYAQTKIAEFQHLPVVCWLNSPVTKCYKNLADEIFLKHNFIDD